MATTYDNASLVMIPSGVKEDKLYSIKPTDGSGDFTFSRGSDIQATRVNSSGLIEKAKVNNLLQSNSFDTTWTTSEASVTGGQAGYDGSSDAWLLSVTSGTGSQRVQQSISASGLTTYSVYVQKGTTDWVALRATGSPVSCLVWFDLTNGVKGSNQNAIDYSITSISGDWYRCTLTTTTTIDNVFIYPATADDLAGLNCTSGDTIYIQDAQLNHGLIAQDYVETTTTSVVEGLTADLPRLDYSGGASCPSLLLEPSRTNLIRYSEYFGSGAYFNNNFDITHNAATSPEGVNNATLLTSNSATGGVYRLYEDSSSAGQAVGTASVFMKYVNNQYCYLSQDDYIGATKYAVFDLINGTNTFASSGYTATITPYANGWYRCTITGEQNTQAYIQIGLSNSDNTYTGNIADGQSVYIWGAQREYNSSYPTSYIPTYGAAANRGADSCLSSSVPSLIGQTEGTIFWQGEVNYLGSDGHAITLSASTSVFGDAVLLYRTTSGQLALYIQIGGSPQFGTPLFYNDSASISANDKYAIGYAQNDLVVYKNGVQVMSASSGNIPATNFVLLNEWNNNINHENITKQALVFPTRLTNAELAALTTL